MALLEQSKKISEKFWLPLLLGVVAAVGMLVGYRLDEEYQSDEIRLIDNQSEVFKPGKIEELIKYVDAKYVDAVDTDKLMENTMGYILNQLDPFSSYLTPSELKRYEDQISGLFDGLGVELRFVRDTLAVFYVFPGSPAEQAGISAGDQIIRIDDEDVVGRTDADIDQLVRDNSTPANFSLISAQSRLLENVKISPAPFKINSVSSHHMLDDSVGYIHLQRFTTSAYKDVMTALEGLSEYQGMKHLVFDLRSNPGGVLREAIKILQEFYSKEGKLILFTQGENMPREEYKTHGKPFHRVDKIAILINHSSASASEVIAGAVQDTDRGIIIGENSYGKGLVQEHYKLRNGGELRLTIARYYTPSGRLIQRPYHKAVDKEFIDTSGYTTYSGREVHAGGGITPDEIVYRPADIQEILDSTIIAQSYEVVFDRFRQAVRKNNEYTIDSAIQNRQLITRDLLDYLVTPELKNDNRFIEQENLIRSFLWSTYVHMIGGSQFTEQSRNDYDPVVLAALNYTRSLDPIAINPE